MLLGLGLFLSILFLSAFRICGSLTFFEELLKHSDLEVWLSQGSEWNFSVPGMPQGENTSSDLHQAANLWHHS